MKNIKFLAIGAALAATTFSITSCSRYLDINNDPNNIPAEKATPPTVFAGAVSESYRPQAQRMTLFSGLMMNSFAGNSYSYGTPFVDEYSFNLTSGFYADIWDNTFRNIANFQLIIDYNDPTGKYANYKAMAKIMKAYYFQILVDFYNDVPYSEFGKLQANLRPKYDKSEDIYKASINDLNDALSLINSASSTNGVAVPGSDDIIFKGSMTNWAQFANSVKLRYLMRMSKVTGDMATFRNTQLATLQGASFITADVTENPGYSAASADSQNPYASYFVISNTGSRPGNYTLVVPSENMAAALNGNVGSGTSTSAGSPLTDAFHQKFTGIVDGRRSRIFTRSSVTGNVEGVRQGATPGQPGADAGRTSIVGRLGYGLSMGTQTPASTADLTAGASAKSGTLMTVSEVDFLLAEASLTFPQYFSGGQAAFNAGITSSFARLGASGAANYLASISSVNGLGWTGSNDQKLDAVMTQKWIALTGINEEQSYFDYLKTGYPNVPVSTITTKNRPYRLVYPTSEYGTNSTNVPNVTADMCFTKNQYTPFWNRN